MSARARMDVLEDRIATLKSVAARFGRDARCVGLASRRRELEDEATRARHFARLAQGELDALRAAAAPGRVEVLVQPECLGDCADAVHGEGCPMHPRNLYLRRRAFEEAESA